MTVEHAICIAEKVIEDKCFFDGYGVRFWRSTASILIDVVKYSEYGACRVSWSISIKDIDNSQHAYQIFNEITDTLKKNVGEVRIELKKKKIEDEEWNDNAKQMLRGLWGK